MVYHDDTTTLRVVRRVGAAPTLRGSNRLYVAPPAKTLARFWPPNLQHSLLPIVLMTSPLCDHPLRTGRRSRLGGRQRKNSPCIFPATCDFSLPSRPLSRPAQETIPEYFPESWDPSEREKMESTRAGVTPDRPPPCRTLPWGSYSPSFSPCRSSGTNRPSLRSSSPSNQTSPPP
jgi:hypothetical protein